MKREMPANLRHRIFQRKLRAGEERKAEGFVHVCPLVKVCGCWGCLVDNHPSRKLWVTLSIEGAKKSVTRRISPGKPTEGFSPFLVQEDQWKCSSAAERVSGHRITALTGTDK